MTFDSLYKINLCLVNINLLSYVFNPSLFGYVETIGTSIVKLSYNSAFDKLHFIVLHLKIYCIVVIIILCCI